MACQKWAESPEPLYGALSLNQKKNPEKYKYIFRTSLNAVYLVKYLAGTMGFIKKQFGFNKVYIMTQDVAWARKTAEILTKVYFNKAGWEIV
ncbi:MAG: hypothetical protein HN580_24705, partial [Deltaproteobacteria bacterium]|nr:hypothetical protein [Deltaproteobacteria bacterium]